MKILKRNEFVPKESHGRCFNCGSCCKNLYFSVMIKDEELIKLKDNLINVLVCLSPFDNDLRIEDWYKWATYHNDIKMKHLPSESKRFFALEIKKGSIKQVLKSKTKNLFIIKVDSQCSKLIDKKCCIHGNHPIICREDIGFPTTIMCGLRWKDKNKNKFH